MIGYVAVRAQRFAAPPANPVPSFGNAAGGADLIVPVVYDDNPNHPWQSGCLGTITPNTILNGDLVAKWSSVHCSFLGMDYFPPKVRDVPFWPSELLNGRFVLLLEVRDRAIPAGPFPGDVAGVDQVVVWIDNQEPIGQLTSIGGVTGCGDLHLRDYVGTTAPTLECLGRAHRSHRTTATAQRQFRRVYPHLPEERRRRRGNRGPAVAGNPGPRHLAGTAAAWGPSEC